MIERRRKQYRCFIFSRDVKDNLEPLMQPFHDFSSNFEPLLNEVLSDYYFSFMVHYNCFLCIAEFYHTSVVTFKKHYSVYAYIRQDTRNSTCSTTDGHILQRTGPNWQLANEGTEKKTEELEKLGKQSSNLWRKFKGQQQFVMEKILQNVYFKKRPITNSQ